MTETGRVRGVDEIGRLVLPKEIRKQFSLQENDLVEFFEQDGYLLLKKKQPVCVFCANGCEKSYKEKPICNNCLAELLRLAEEPT